jgi:hypothetical protein
VLAALRIEQAVPEVESLGRESPDRRKEPDVAGKKRPKSAQTEKKAPPKPKRPKKTSRGK